MLLLQLNNLLEPSAGALVGSSSITFDSTAALTGTGDLSGSSSITFTGSATLGGTFPITGSTSITFTPAGTIADAAAAAVEAEESPTGGWGASNYYEAHLQRVRHRRRKREEEERELAKLDPVDLEIAHLLRKDIEREERDREIAELESIIDRTNVNLERKRLARETTEQIANAYTRAYMQRNFSALEAFERQLEEFLEEEEVMFLAFTLLQ